MFVCWKRAGHVYPPDYPTTDSVKPSVHGGPPTVPRRVPSKQRNVTRSFDDIRVTTYTISNGSRFIFAGRGKQLQLRYMPSVKSYTLVNNMLKAKKKKKKIVHIRTTVSVPDGFDFDAGYKGVNGVRIVLPCFSRVLLNSNALGLREEWRTWPTSLLMNT